MEVSILVGAPLGREKGNLSLKRYPAAAGQAPVGLQSTGKHNKRTPKKD